VQNVKVAITNNQSLAMLGGLAAHFII